MTKRLILALLLIAISANVHAQRFNTKKIHEGHREGTWEVSLLTQYQNSTSKSLEGGSGLAVDSKVGWGFGIGWNWTDKLNLSYQFSLIKPGYTATLVPEDPEAEPRVIDYTMTRYSNRFNVAWNFFNGPLTPFVQAGVGWSKLDSNIPKAPPITGCWWDPWWGYICDTTWDTRDASGFSYNAGIGLRWDVANVFYWRGAWNHEIVQLDQADMSFDLFTLEFGLMW